MQTLTIIPGAPKSGTTSLIESIASSIENAGYEVGEFVKEPGFLLEKVETKFQALRTIQNLGEYRRRILSHNGLSFDATQAYFTCDMDQTKLDLIREIYSRINLLFILRNPYDRIVSAYRMDLSNGWVDKHLDHYLDMEISGVRNPYGSGPRYIEESCYSYNIGKLKESIRPDDMKIILYERYNDNNYVTDILKSQGFPYRINQIERSNVTQDAVPPRWISMIKEIIPPSLRQRVKNSELKRKLKNYMYRRPDEMYWASKMFPIKQIEADKERLLEYLHTDQKTVVENWCAKISCD